LIIPSRRGDGFLRLASYARNACRSEDFHTKARGRMATQRLGSAHTHGRPARTCERHRFHHGSSSPRQISWCCDATFSRDSCLAPPARGLDPRPRGRPGALLHPAKPSELMMPGPIRQATAPPSITHGQPATTGFITAPHLGISGDGADRCCPTGGLGGSPGRFDSVASGSGRSADGAACTREAVFGSRYVPQHRPPRSYRAEPCNLIPPPRLTALATRHTVRVPRG
jgi:hypothetical protein